MKVAVNVTKYIHPEGILELILFVLSILAFFPWDVVIYKTFDLPKF